MLFKNHGLLGQNARNLVYIRGGDFALGKRLADSKLSTKKFLASRGVAVPETIAIIKRHKDLSLEKVQSFEPPFVIKPNNGYGGKGILIIDEKSSDGGFVTNTGEVYSAKRLYEHCLYVLDGFFSLSGGRDSVIIEKKIVLTSEIELLGTFGLPDLRVIVYNMVPVMAMIRIPTKESDGKANIHAGACAAGIDIGSGKITYISKNGVSVRSVPGLGDIRGITIPDWETVLGLAVQVQKVTNIKFLGCDIVLDKEAGPLLLEINIRPGLEIQNVNLSPLRSRLERVEGLEVNTVEKGVRLGRDLFSGDIEERIKNLSGKQIAGRREYIHLFHDDKTYSYIADIRISDTESFIDRAFVRDILRIDESEKKAVRIEGEILGMKKNFRFKIEDLGGEKIRLGQQSLKGFLIDPYKYKKGENPILTNLNGAKVSNAAITTIYTNQIKDLDKKIMDIDKKLLILKYVTPINISEEKQIFIERRGEYIPKFKYRELPFDIGELSEKLDKIEIPEIPGANLYSNKKVEVQNKLKFLEAFINQDHSDMMLYSQKLFGDITDDNFDYSKNIIALREEIIEEDEFLDIEEIKQIVKKFNTIYNIAVKVQESDTSARFTMKGDILMYRRGAVVGKREMRSIIAHEIEGHYLRKLNGKKSGLTLMRRGGAGYIEADEGIAIYNQNRFLTKTDKKYYSIFERYYFVQYAKKHSYKKLIERLGEFYNNDYERIFNYMLRLKRGFVNPSKEGVFMKDVVYVNGFLQIKDYLESGKSFEELYIGKLSVGDVATAYNHSLYSSHKKDLLIPFSA